MIEGLGLGLGLLRSLAPLFEISNLLMKVETVEWGVRCNDYVN